MSAAATASSAFAWTTAGNASVRTPRSAPTYSSNNATNSRCRAPVTRACRVSIDTDTAVREHFEGYRSHTTLLAGVFGVVTAGVVFFAKAPWIAVVIAAAAVFVVAFVLLRRAYRRSSLRRR